MPLHPQVKQLLFLVETSGEPPLNELSPPEAREAANKLRVLVGQGPELPQVEDFQLPTRAGEITARRYVPEDPQATILWLHGGGWVIGDLESHDAMCRLLAQSSGCRVVAVDYRLAPEHPFPAAADDCYAAAAYVAGHAAEFRGDARRVAIGGDSAGGNLTAVVAQMARDKGGPRFVHQLLVYPVTDGSLETPSMRENATGYFLTTRMMHWFWNHYAPTAADRANPYASPLRARDLRGLPPATVFTAEFDPLRDEGEMYAAKLQEAGVPVRQVRYDGMIHGFFGMLDQFDDAKRAVDEAATALRSAFR